VCNGALRKPAYQISVNTTENGNGSYPALLATDGSHVSNLKFGSCAMSGLAVNPWWAVDLGSYMYVQFVTLTTRKRRYFTDVLSNPQMWQVAPLSQRDRAAGWVSYGQQRKTGTGRQYLRIIIGLSLTTVT